uniref:Peptidase S1 domain-containing protein n=1 Tax=Anopheles merus TaxID=30066 RepID=A0A182V5X5_ANOME
MQILATIMRLVVILSVLVQIYASTGSGGGAGLWTRHGLVVTGPSPMARSMMGPPVAGEQRATNGPPERNVYRTKLSKLRLILLADMLNDIQQNSIASNRAPWLFRVGLIETKHPVCVGALIHPSLILTTAVCVINKQPEELIVWSERAPERPEERTRWPVGRILLPEKFATTFERLENNVALLLLLEPLPSAPPTEAPVPIGSTGGLRARPVSVRSSGGGGGSSSVGGGDAPRPNLARTQLFRAQRKRPPASICLSSIIDRAAAPPASSRSPSEYACYTVSLRKTNLPSTTAPATQPPPAAGSTGADDWLANDGTNYVTTNISIFPATECRPEHREYLQHDGNLCAGYGAAKNRSIDVDYSGSPLICDQLLEDGKLRRTVQGLLTWSTDINHAPHLFTNLTTYRPWIDREIEKLDAETRSQRPPNTVPRPITLQTVPVYRNPNVLYG